MLYLSISFFFISILTATYKNKNIYFSFFNALVIFLYLVLFILYFSANYFTDEGINDAVLFTVLYGLGGAGFGEYIILIAISIFLFIFTFAISYLYFRILKNSVHTTSKRFKGVVHNTFLLLAFLTHPFILDVFTIYQNREIKQSIDFEQYYSKTKSLIQKTNGLNLIYIYAESLENTYFDEEVFPGLMKELQSLKKKSYDFTDINQVIGTEWTIAGMVSSQCSIPLFMESSGGSSMSGVDTFLSGVECLGDILKKSGYHMVFMQGSSVDFSGIRQFYSSHNFTEIYGREELKGKLKDSSYLNGWGLYDDSLFPMVYDKFKELSQQSKPFGIFMATIDTHHPNGQPSKSCNTIPYGDGKNTILNAVHCSDKLIAEFIRKIQNSKYAKNTLIILTSDHLAMKNTATHLLKVKKRKNLFLVFDPTNKQYIPISKPGSMLDVGPTILHKLGIETDLGLGRNLFNKESLFIVFKNFNKKLSSWRNKILEYWNFPKLSDSYHVNLTDMKINIANHSYKLPVLLKIENNYELIPIFEFDSVKKLSSYIQKFQPTQKFIWIDRCHKINFLLSEKHNGELCISQGTLSGEIEIYNIDYNNREINTKILQSGSEINKRIYNLRQAQLSDLSSISYIYGVGKEYNTSLSEGIIFDNEGYPNFIDKVYGMAKRQHWLRWSDANLAKNAKFVFKEKLPKDFILEIVVGAYGTNIGKPVKIKIANQVQWLTIKRKNPDKYKIIFRNVDSNIIEFTPPSPMSPNGDPRKIGISFVSLKVKPVELK